MMEPAGILSSLTTDVLVSNKDLSVSASVSFDDSQYDLEENDKQQFLKNELWVKDKFEKWQKEKNEEVKKQMAENARFKAYRRYMKNHGPGRMVFDDS